MEYPQIWHQSKFVLYHLMKNVIMKMQKIVLIIVFNQTVHPTVEKTPNGI